MKQIKIVPGEIEKSADSIFEYLQINITEIVYNSNKSIEESEKLNAELLNDFTNKALVYSIHVKENESWKCMYVGQTQADSSRNRIRNHLFKKDHRTGSMLEKIKKIYKTQKIGISAVEINPAIMRHPVESIIIAKNYGELLQWNKDETK